MAYEKFIKKDGKLYGPYIYHSKRVDGKVVSEYHGQKKFDLRFLWIVPIVFLAAFGIYLIWQNGNSPTGYSVLDLNADYKGAGSILNETQNKTKIPQIIIQEIELTEGERAALIKEFRDLSVKQEEKLRNNIIIVRYEIGEYWIEHSYPSNLNNETLYEFMKADKTKWLKDLAGRINT